MRWSDHTERGDPPPIICAWVRSNRNSSTFSSSNFTVLMIRQYFTPPKFCAIRYASKHASQCLSDKPFPPTCLDTELENFRAYMDFQHIKLLVCYWKHSLCCLELHERFDWITTAPAQTRIGLSLIQRCVCILPAHTYITIWCITSHDNKTHVPYDWRPHTKNSFSANDASFYKNKFG